MAEEEAFDICINGANVGHRYYEACHPGMKFLQKIDMYVWVRVLRALFVVGFPITAQRISVLQHRVYQCKSNHSQ